MERASMSEFIDLYDKERKFLNRVVDRTTYLFQPGEFMMYVLAVLENQDGKYLVTQRALNKKWAAGHWEMPGGGAKSKESSLDAIKREVKEETNLDVKNGRVVYSYFNEDNDRHDNYFVDIYHFKFDFKLSDVVLNTNESIDCKCVTLDELVLMNEKQSFLHYERIMKALQQEK